MPARKSEEKLQWVSLSNFTPGIWNASGRGLGTTAVPAPLGAAQQTNTYRCVALPGGGLAPLPKMTKTWASTDPASTYSSGPWLTSMYAFGPTNASSAPSAYPDEIFLIVEWLDSTPNRHARFYRLNAFAAVTVTNTLASADSTTASPVNQFWGSAFGSSRMNTTDPTLPGVPVVVWDWYEQPGEGNAGYTYTFPDPSTSNVTAVMTLSTTMANTVCHQGRVLQLDAAIYSHGATSNVPTNENVNFTDPPNSATMGTQNEVFSQENPVGYGAWGSISAGELFLVKNSGGGVIVSGDIANPSITRLPGVVPAGQMMSKASSTPHGLFYLANEGGVYVWRGGDTSAHVSPQLSPNSFPNNAKGTSTDTLNPSLIGIQAHLEAWQNWVLVSNNWLYDTQTNSWWQIESQDTINIRWWSRGSHTNLMYGAPISYDPDIAVYTWDKSIAALSWSWQSHPIPASIDRLVEVREMVLVAQGTGTVTVTMTGIDPAGADFTQSETFTVTHTAQPQRLGPAVGRTFIKGYNVVVRIESSGADAAPIVYAVHLGTRQAQQATET